MCPSTSYLFVVTRSPTMSSVSLGEHRSRLLAAPPDSIIFDDNVTNEGHIIEFTTERLRPDNDGQNFSFNGTNSIVIVIESPSHFLDTQNSWFEIELNVHAGDASATKGVDQPVLIEGPAACFRSMMTTVSGVVCEDIREFNMLHHTIEDYTIDQTYRNSQGVIENFGNRVSRTTYHSKALQYTTGYKAQAAGSDARGNAFLVPWMAPPHANGTVATAGQRIIFRPISGIMQNRKLLPLPVMGPIRLEFTLDNPLTCVQHNAGNNPNVVIKSFSYVAKMVEP